MHEELKNQIEGILKELYWKKSLSAAIKKKDDLRNHLEEHLESDRENESEVSFTTALPKKHWPKPPSAAREVIQSLPQDGFDPIAGMAQPDLLWRSAYGPVVVEVELEKNAEWDIYGHGFLRDIYRLERLLTVGQQAIEPVARFALIVSSNKKRWERGGYKTAPSIEDGRVLQKGELVQYSQDSLETRWGKRYAPFYLANDYRLEWTTLVVAKTRCLIVAVAPQK